jgi:hypothetical protein
MPEFRHFPSCVLDCAWAGAAANACIREWRCLLAIAELTVLWKQMNSNATVEDVCLGYMEALSASGGSLFSESEVDFMPPGLAAYVLLHTQYDTGSKH